MLFSASHSCSIPVDCVLVFTNMCSNPIPHVLSLYSILVFSHSLLQIPARFTNVHLATLTTGYLVDDAFLRVLELINRCLHPHQRLSQLVSRFENGLYTKLSQAFVPTLHPESYSEKIERGCRQCHMNWWKLILFLGFGPLTCFCIFVLVFHVNITSSRMQTIILFSQIITASPFLKYVYINLSNYPCVFWLLRILDIFHFF